MEQQQNNYNHSDIQSTKIRQRVVDTAEPWDIAGKLIETGWERNKMFCGDYWLMTHSFQRVGITRKTTDDLLGSIFLTDNKAKEIGKHPFVIQLDQMLDRYDIKKILIEGSWRRIFEEDITRKHVWNFLDAWQDKGFTLEITTDQEMTIKRLNELYAKYQEPYTLVANTKGFSDDRILAFPSGSRGKTAKDCLEIFGSLKRVAEATIDELVCCPNIGVKKATMIVEHFNKSVGGVPEFTQQKSKYQIEVKEGEQPNLL